MTGHNGHSKLGSYCWTCGVNLAVGTPGFPRRSRSDGPKVEQKFNGVTWLDGTRDNASEDRNPCNMCHNPKCSMPVHHERYREVTISKALMAKTEDN